jgi:putative transposase
MKKQHVQLSETDRQFLKKIVREGQQKARVYKRAIGLLELDRGKTYAVVAETVGVHSITISKWAQNYRQMGLDCLHDQPKGRPAIEIDGDARAKITALACSEPPEGYAQWSLRMLADKAVELEYTEHISHTKVADILKKMN